MGKFMSVKTGECAVVYGATASGKSAFALDIAARRPSVIINADSMQVYSDLKVLTACPSDEETNRYDFRLYGFLTGDKSCSAALWAELAAAEIKNAWQRGLYPIVVGGTGLYINTLLDGLAPVPDIPDDIRNKVRAMDFEEARHLLYVYDRATFDRFTDNHRTLRALEVYLATGKPHSEWQKEPRLKLITANWQRYFINPERQELYRRCDERFLAMLEQGAISEVESLVAKEYPDDSPIMKALGVPEIALFLKGEMSREEMIIAAQTRTRNYAKRQLTWFRKTERQFLNTD